MEVNVARIRDSSCAGSAGCSNSPGGGRRADAIAYGTCKIA